MDSDVTGFVKGLSTVKNIYAECPSCSHIFSLYSARLMYGKSPPKDFLSKAQRQTEKAREQLGLLQEQFDEAQGDWQQRLQDVNEKWRGRLELKESIWEGKESTLKE